MIDLHCHLLPGIDDGPADLETAIAMARAQLAVGVGTVVATPHVHPDVPNDATGIARAVDGLRAALEQSAVPLEVVPGAEIDLLLAQELSDDELRALAIGGGPWLLIEAPLVTMPHTRAAVGRLLARGHAVVLAHPERSPSLHRDIDTLRRLAGAGVLMQVTAGSLTGQFGRTVQRFSQQLIDEGLVHVVASDAHDVDRRPPGLTPALQRAGLSASASLLTELVPAAVLAGDPVPAVPARRRRHGLLERLGLR
jgi:protein-tyrosine phosphatase